MMSGYLSPRGQTNVGSLLLSQQENEKLFSYLGRKCVSLSSAVVEVFTADRSGSWNPRCRGVACLVKDNPLRSYFLRVFDIKKGKNLFEQELHANLSVNPPKPQVITFTGDTSQVSLKFSSEEERERFQSTMSELLRRRQRSAAVNSQGNQKGARKVKGNKKLTKADIGTPEHFLHVNHVGWNPSTGFDLNSLDPELKKLFEMAGITEAELKDRETSKAIHDFIEQNGGVEAVKNEVRKQGSAKPTAAVSIQSPEPSGVRHHHNSSQVNNTVRHASVRKSKGKGKKKKKKVTKADIGTPSNFQHTSHIGWNPNTGFDLNNLDPELKALLDMAGITEAELKDRETSKVIHDFFEENGGVEAVKNEVQRQGSLKPTAAANKKNPQIGNVHHHSSSQVNTGRQPFIKKSKDKGKKKKLTKLDIGTPSNFQHLNHVSWNPSSCVDLNNLDPEMKNLFDSSGVSEADPKDRKTSKAIHGFVEKNGGAEAVKSEVQRQAPPSVQPKSGPSTSSQHQSSASSHPPQIMQGSSSHPPDSSPAISAPPPSSRQSTSPPPPHAPARSSILVPTPSLNPESSCRTDSVLDRTRTRDDYTDTLPPAIGAVGLVM